MNGAAAIALAVEPVASPAAIEEPVSAESQAIASAVALAVTGFCYALLERQEGALRPEVKSVVAERIAEVAMLKLNHDAGDEDFDRHARGAKSILRQAFDADYLRRYTPKQVDRTVDVFLDELLTVVARVVAAERAFRTN